MLLSTYNEPAIRDPDVIVTKCTVYFLKSQLNQIVGTNRRRRRLGAAGADGRWLPRIGENFSVVAILREF